MKHFLDSKTNVIGTCLLIISVFLVIILKGSFAEWGMFAGVIFGAVTGRNINKTRTEAKVETKNVQ